MSRVRTLIVDDSASMRSMLAGMLRRDPEIDVIGEAADAREARAMIKELNPDVLTLDIEMPGMNGIDFIEKIMTLRPMPVVIVSSASKRGADVTVRALELGAYDCFLKPTTPAAMQDGALATLVKQAAACPIRKRPSDRQPLAAPNKAGNPIIAIGASTGGVEALLEVIGGFPANCPPTVIVQHMPALFTSSFAGRLDRLCPPAVSEARSGDLLEPGRVLLAPGGLQHLEVIGAATPRCRLYEGNTVSGHRPSVDTLFRSVAKLARPAIGILLTGMGADGAAGLLEMRNAGKRTIGQDEASSVVYGMPGVAKEIGAVECQVPLGKVAALAMEMAQ